MSTIKVTKKVSINSISEINEFIHKHGKDNVNLSNVNHFLYYAIENGINTSEWLELFNIANDEILCDTISSLFLCERYLNAFVNAFGVTTEKFVEHLNNIAISRKLEISRVPACTSIEQLNALAELGLLNMFFVERVESIDEDFVRKYYQEMDLSSLINNTNNSQLRELAMELRNKGNNDD